jgi:hypothetical protein
MREGKISRTRAEWTQAENEEFFAHLEQHGIMLKHETLFLLSELGAPIITHCLKGYEPAGMAVGNKNRNR